MREFIPNYIVDPVTGENKKCYLVKYENKEYKTVRIGTLEYYRKIEGNQADLMEGKVEGIIYKSEQDRYVTRQDILSISGGSLDIVARDGIKFGKGGAYTDEKSRCCPNAHVFCCSMEFGIFPNTERLKHFKANEFTVIDKVEEFKKAISYGLFKCAKSKDGQVYNRDTHYIKCWDAPVRYANRKKAKMTLPLNNLDFFIYQKSPDFIIEQEYRFTWIFFDKKTNRSIEAAFDPVDVSCIHEIGAAYVI